MTMDPTFHAPRNCFLSPIPELDIAADLLADAADALLASQHERTGELLRSADMPVLRDYALRIMGPEDRWIHRRRSVPAPPAAELKAVQRNPSVPVERMLYARDGWRCRFCGCRVVTKPARDRMRRLLPGAIRVDVPAREYHAAFLALTAVPDHVAPHSLGGGSEPENLVTACWPCNNGRGAYRLEEMGLADPRSRPPMVDTWDGLSRLLSPALPSACRQPANTSTFPVMTDATGRDSSEPVARGVAMASAGRRPARQTPARPAPWLARLEELRPGLTGRLIAFADSCADLGVSYGVNDVLVFRIPTPDGIINPMAVEATGELCIPWLIGEYKPQFRRFAEAVAEAIPGADVIESRKQWIVKQGGRKPDALALLAAADAVRQALEDLRAAVQDA
jgi:HNH endonuclease